MEYRNLKDLKKLEGNPRLIKDKQFKALCDSIRENQKFFEARPRIFVLVFLSVWRQHSRYLPS